MPEPIRMPDLGTTVDQIKLVRWLKTEGDRVERGEPICEVETDKAASELESAAQGILLRRLVPEGEEIEQGTVIAYVGTPGERVADPDPDPEAQHPTAGAAQAPRRTANRAGVPPLLRNLARQHGVDLERVAGTGPGGRITRQDVLRARGQASPPGGEPLSANQVAVARRVQRSHQQIPPISLTARIDMTAVLALRRGIDKKSGRKVSFDAFFVRAAAAAMADFPPFRSQLAEERLVESEECRVGIAIDVDQKLFVPVIRNAHLKSVSDIDGEVRSLAEKGDAGHLTPEELSGATLTVSNLGMFPVVAFQAIIPPNQVAVLAVGAIEDTPVVRGGCLVFPPLCAVTLTVDHRVINGREAARFLARLKELMESA